MNMESKKICQKKFQKIQEKEDPEESKCELCGSIFRYQNKSFHKYRICLPCAGKDFMSFVERYKQEWDLWR
jgi:hypothetical protein